MIEAPTGTLEYEKLSTEIALCVRSVLTASELKETCLPSMTSFSDCPGALTRKPFNTAAIRPADASCWSVCPDDR
jgi:hypothetical protein